jgi:pyruvate dehydrogenase E1 component subunit alpha
MTDLRFLDEMVLIREFEEKAAELYTEQKIRGFLHLYCGEEAIAVGTMEVLTENDNVVSTYREHGHAIARGIPLSSILLELYGKQEGCSRGRGGSMHLFDLSKRFYGGHAIVAGGLPLAVGLGLASKMRKEESLTACYLGDGSVAEGAFHESLNLAALWKVPVLFICENNFYAMGTHISDHQSQPDLTIKAQSYNVAAEKVDGMDVLAVKAATQKAVEHIRQGLGPYFMECETYRFRAHSMYDPEFYRTKEEVEEWKKRDPIELYFSYLKDKNLAQEGRLQESQREAQAKIAEAIEIAERGTLEPVADLTKYVYSEES